jgi:uncharacterized protein YkwD
VALRGSRSLDWCIGNPGAGADFDRVTCAKALLAASVVIAAVVLGMTAAPARSSLASSTKWTAWCVQHGRQLPENSLTSPLICPTSQQRAATTSGNQLTALNRQIGFAINKFRRAHGLVPLRISAQLNASARQHSEEMGAKGYFDHNSANGTAWWKRIQHYYPVHGYTYWTVGENLLFASPSIGADAAMKLWIASPDHLRNLKDPNWRNLGVSAVHVLKAGGVYEGQEVTIITTDFGARH